MWYIPVSIKWWFSAGLLDFFSFFLYPAGSFGYVTINTLCTDHRYSLVYYGSYLRNSRRSIHSLEKIDVIRYISECCLITIWCRSVLAGLTSLAARLVSIIHLPGTNPATGIMRMEGFIPLSLSFCPRIDQCR